MATNNDIKEYTSYDIDEFLVHEQSVLNLYAQQDAIGIDQAFEGVPGGNIIFGGLQIRKKKYTDTANGIWIGIDSDGIAKMAIGDASGGFTWDGTTLTITGGGFIPEGGAAADVNDNTTTISGTKITTGTITASKMNVSELSSITADIGSITSGTITSALIRTSSSGARVEIDDSNDRIEVYDSGGTERMRLDSDELIFYDANGTETGSFEARFSNIIALTFPSDKLGFVVYSGSTAKFAVSNASVVCYDELDLQGQDIVDVDDIFSGGQSKTGSIDFSSTSEIKCDEEFSPVGDGVHDLGEPSDWWNDIYVEDVNYDSLTLGSDRSLKENIVTSSYGLAEILQLSPVKFNYKKRKTPDGAAMLKRKKKNPERYAFLKEKQDKNWSEKAAQKHIGLIAQDVQSVMPELVKRRKDGKLGLHSVELIPVLVKAIQELKKEIEVLKN